jgi:hypothetical protein
MGAACCAEREKTSSETITADKKKEQDINGNTANTSASTLKSEIPAQPQDAEGKPSAL